MSLIPTSYWKTKTGISTDQIILYLDAGNVNSYSGTGNTWFDLTGNSNASITGNMATGWNSSGFFQLRTANNTYADVDLVGVNSSTPLLSIEMWYKPFDMGTTGAMPFGFGTYDVFINNNGLGFNTAAGDQRGAYLSRLRNENWWYDQWHHMVFVMHQTSSYTNNKIYINGRLYDSPEQIMGSEDAGLRGFSNGILRISSWRTNTLYPVNGDLAIFRVYNKELTENEVSQNFEFERTRFGKNAVKPHPQLGCRMYFDFEGEFDWYTSSGSYVKDFSRFFNFGLLYGGIGWNSGSGGHMQFRSTNSRYVDTNRATNSFGLFYGSASYVFVFRYLTSGSLQYIFHPTDNPSFGNDANIRVESNNLIYSHNDGTPISYGTLSANTWYHVAITYDYDSYSVKMYINGSEVIGNGNEERVVGLTGYYLGRSTGQFFDFDLGLFMLYNRVISSSEVTELYNTQKTRFGI